MPVAMNVFGSARRMAMALGVDQDPAGLDAVAAAHREADPGGHAQARLQLPGQAGQAADAGGGGRLDAQDRAQGHLPGGGLAAARRPGSRACRCSPPGPRTAARSSPWAWATPAFRSGQRNMGLYRLQVYDEHTLGFHTQLHHDGARARHGYAPGERMPVAVSFGGDPALTYAATRAPAALPVGDHVHRLPARGGGGDGPLRHATTWRCRRIPRSSSKAGWTPANCAGKGPFGDHTGYYSLADDYPVLHVEAITHRKHPVYPATIVGRPPQEDAYLGLATERIFLPLLKMVLPEVVDMHLPPAGGFHNLVIVAIRKEYPGHAQKVMNAIWGTGQMMFSKGIVVVDQDIDPHDGAEVLFRVTSNVDPRRDLLFTDGPLDVLDHSSDRFAFGSKVGIDATRKSPRLDGFPREWPRDLVFPRRLLERITGRWKEYGL